MRAAVTRRSALRGSAVAALGLVAGVAPALAVASTPSAASSISSEAAALQAELARLSSTYRRACRESDAVSQAMVDFEPPEALYARPGDAQLLWGRIPVKSWQDPDRYWFCDEDLVGRLRADPFHHLDGSPTLGAARRDEIVNAWDGWQAAQKAAEDASGLTAAEERFEAAFAAYAEFRVRLVEMRTDDPEILTVKALCIADLCGRAAERLGSGISRALKRDAGAYEDALALSLARDFLGLMGTGVIS